MIHRGATTPLFSFDCCAVAFWAQGAKIVKLFPTRPARALSLLSGFDLDLHH